MTSSLLSLPSQRGPVVLSPDQQKFRQTLLTATDMAAIMGLDEYRTGFDVWLEKTGQAPAYKPSIPARRGQYLEPLVVELYAEEHDDIADIRQGTTIAHPEHKIIGATPDYYIDTIYGTTRLLECKTKTYMSAKRQQLGAAGTDELPDKILLQVQQQMFVTGVSFAHVAVLVDDTLRVYNSEANKELCQYILSIGYDWWDTHMVKGIKPALDGSDGAKYYQAVKTEFTKAEPVEAEGDFLFALTEFASLKDREKDVKESLETVKQRLIELCNGNKKFVSPIGSVTFSKTEGRKSTDWKKVVKEASVAQGIIDKYTKVGEEPSISVRFVRAE